MNARIIGPVMVMSIVLVSNFGCSTTSSRTVATPPAIVTESSVRSPDERLWEQCSAIERQKRTAVWTVYEVTNAGTKTAISKTLSGQVSLSGGPVLMLEGAATGQVRVITDNTSEFFSEMKKAYSDYLSAYPQGAFAEKAQAMIRRLDQEQTSKQAEVTEAVEKGRVKVMRF